MIESPCPICLGCGNRSSVLCCESSHAPVCDDCLATYIQHKIQNDFNGHCSAITCPCVHPVKPILKYQRWITLPKLNDHIVETHTIHASSLLSFLCAGCHVMRSLSLVRASKFDRSTAQSKIEELIGSDSKLTILFEQLRLYEQGSSSLDKFFNFVYAAMNLHALSSAQDRAAWEIFRNILMIIVDPERQCTLHLRYLRLRPRIWTSCCNKEHCFRCRTKDFHAGKSCAENAELLDSSIIDCPSCRIAVVKGDGCNTVTCVCGNMFSWVAEMDNTERSRRFQSEFGYDTHTACVEVLCGDIPGQQLDARAWRARNKIEVDFRLLLWWKVKYSPYPSQVCALLPNLAALRHHVVTDGENEARLLWEMHHPVETEKFRQQNHFARKSLFHTFFPREDDRPAAAVSILHTGTKMNGYMSGCECSKALVNSAELWKAENILKYEQELEAREGSAANQFLCLYGSQHPTKNQILSGQVVAPLEWNRSMSNTALQYSNNDLTVERVGGVSSYPAAFANLPCASCKFTVVIDKCQRGPNWLTFGIAKRGMPTSSSDGVGRTRDSWGLSDDRSSTSGRCRVCASGTELTSCRKFQCGDILSAHVDVNEGWCIVSINENEFSYQFSVPPGQCDDYVFAMTFANDHCVTIVPNIGPISSQIHNVLNPEHFHMLQSLRRRLKKIYTGKSTIAISKIEEMASAWEASFKSSNDAMAAYHENEKFIRLLIGLPGDYVQSEVMHEPQLCTISWQQVVYAICWEKTYRIRRERERRESCARTVAELFGDSAPFLAAAGLVDFSGPLAALYQPLMVTREDALAYMEFYPEEMNQWYEYNAALEEPLFGLNRVSANCRCLPRHIGVCPLQG